VDDLPKLLRTLKQILMPFEKLKKLSLKVLGPVHNVEDVTIFVTMMELCEKVQDSTTQKG
jgi:hypothetical protein